MRIIDIATIAGVSTATVSRVINDSGYVKDGTRKRVLDIIAQYNYIPNAVARSLSTNNSLNLGVAIPDIENEFFSKVIRGITEIANLNDYNVFFFESNETPEKEHDSLKIFMEQRLCGLIIAPVAEDDPETRKALRRIHRGGTPIILVDRDISGEKFDGVFADNRNGAYAAVETFIREGHRKISVISGPQSTKPGRERYEGYKKALEAHGIEIREEYVQNSDFRVQRAYECANRLLALPDPPTAVFTSNNLSTLGFLKSMREHRITVGRDISIIGYDVIEALEILDYNISVVQRDAVEQGRVAMRLMIERLRGKNAPEGVKELMPYRIVLKGSEKYDWRRHEG